MDRRPALVVALLAAALAASATAVADEFTSLAESFRKQVSDPKPAVRLHAYDSVGKSSDPKAVDLILDGLGQEVARKDELQKSQAASEKELEGVLSEIDKLNATTPKSQKEIDVYNRRVKKLEGKRDALNDRLRDVGSDLTQQDAVAQNAVGALGAVLGRLPPDAAGAALTRIADDWSGPKATEASSLRYVDLLGSMPGAESARRLRLVSLDEAAAPDLRAVALQYRAGRAEEAVIGDAVSLLEGTSWPVVGAAIEALQQMHRRDGIEPLIAFLGRGDIGVLREKAHRALRSLTGQAHGPYMAPWRDWWLGAKAAFRMPEKPAAPAALLAPDKGVTFFGITTFSDRILYVLDVSGSMLEPAHPGAAGQRGEERRIDAARRALFGSIDMLDEKKVFNAIFFNHKVVQYQGGAITADKIGRERAKQFAAKVEPTGGTNIHDALEAAFALARPPGQTGKAAPLFDTIYFLTDGTPTAGKVQKPDAILDAVADWNRGLHMTIHVVGIGEADPTFLKALAERNEGTFVQR